MNRIHFKKLLRSKWTARHPKGSERHFEVVGVLPAAETEAPHLIVVEAIYTNRLYTMPWDALKDTSRWIVGWK